MSETLLDNRGGLTELAACKWFNCLARELKVALAKVDSAGKIKGNIQNRIYKQVKALEKVFYILAESARESTVSGFNSKNALSILYKLTKTSEGFPTPNAREIFVLLDTAWQVYCSYPSGTCSDTLYQLFGFAEVRSILHYLEINFDLQLVVPLDIIIDHLLSIDEPTYLNNN